MFEHLPGHRPLLAAGLGAVVVSVLALSAEAPEITRGRELFDKAFTKAEGLGSPEMNADTCRGCHSDPVLGGAGALELNVTRFALDHAGAGPFENLPGGQASSKLRPPQDTLREEQSVDADCFEQRQTPSILGDGLIDAIPDAVIIANEDPLDANADGIRGVARRLQINGAQEIGRFGWKAQIPRLADFVRDAMFGELGITSPDDGRGFGTHTDGDATPDPEINSIQVANVFAFMASLPAPARAGSTDARVPQGEALFTSIGCAKCHIPSLDGPTGAVPLFSDLLLHNVMEVGYRGMAEPGAGVGVFRTPPLWGVRNTAPYMHDGRAENLRAAILAHFGEAIAVRNEFLVRTTDEQEALIAFLQDL